MFQGSSEVAEAGTAAAIGGDRQTRVLWMDAAKGIGIILVVAGHVWTRGPVRDAIYAFHMPLFFLLSGYLARPQPMGPMLARQGRMLLLPFLAFSALLLAADFAIEGIRQVRPVFPSFVAGARAILVETGDLTGPFTILWFVPCLFFARLAWNVVARRVSSPFDWRWPVLVIVLMAGAHALAEMTEASPLGLMAVPAAVTLFWAGHAWRERLPRLPLILLMVPLALAVLLWLPPVNLKAGHFGMPFVSLAGAVAVTILLCLGLSQLPHRLTRPLATVGRASLVIMYVHVAFIHYCAPYFSEWVLFGIAMAGSLAVHAVAAATQPGRVLLLGRLPRPESALTP